MSAAFWYYVILQALVLILLFQVSRQNQNLKLKTNLKTHKIIDYINPRTCTDYSVVDKFKQFHEIMKWNVHGSGYDPVVATDNQKSNNNQRNVHQTKYQDIKININSREPESNTRRRTVQNTHTTYRTQTATVKSSSKNDNSHGQTHVKRTQATTKTNPNTGDIQKTHSQIEYKTPV